MRKIKIKSWKAKLDKDTEIDEDLLSALNVLLGNKKPEDIPRGMDKMRLFGRIRKAFEKADETKELVLEESEYEFLKSAVEKEVPATWGMNENLSKALEQFLEAKQE